MKLTVKNKSVSDLIILKFLKQPISNFNLLNSSNGMKNLMLLFALVVTFLLSNTSNANTGRFRAMFGDDPSTDMTIGFDAYALNTNPVLYYSTNPININNLNSYTSQTPDKVVDVLGMINCFVRLVNLQPGQTYYFVVKDNSSVSDVYNFETIPNTNTTQLSIIAGGDSRNNWDVRANANKIVSKLNADAFMFDGDFTDNGTPNQWQRWLDDWQLTINSTNRITPIIPARGNHEANDNMLINLFDCRANIIDAKTLGDNLLQIYTLNSEKAITYASTQTSWLEAELSNSNAIWKFAQYHKPIRPHVSTKAEGSMQYAYWANLFYQYGVDAVVEGDAHTVKTTWPLIPCSGGFDCYEGFKRDDINGTVYLGEGSYSAPIRLDNDIKPWTRDSGMFHQFKWIFVSKDKMEARTVKYDANTNTNAINELTSANRFTIPQNLEIWNPLNGDVVTKFKPTSNIPTCTLTSPYDNQMYFNLNTITLSANATGISTIAQVQFYVDGTLVGTDNSAPYQSNWQPTSNGVYIISAIAQDVNGLSSAMDLSVIKIGAKNSIVHTATIDISSDEYKELDNGSIEYNNWNIDICESGTAIQGLRFKEINVPPNSIIESAHITFVVTSGWQDSSNSTFWSEKDSDGLPFKVENNNLSNRTKTNNSVAWNDIPVWPSSSIQETPDLSSVVQELVQLPDWSIESPIVFLFGGSGKRVAKSYSRDESLAPILTVQFSLPDCPTSTCDDGNPNTINDSYDDYCRCIGEAGGCTDASACNFDSNAVADDNSCAYPNTPCDDGNANTSNDAYNANCTCLGVETCPTDITHSGTLSGDIYQVSNSIESTAVVDQNERVDYDAGAFIHLDKGFLANSGEGVYLLAKIEGCTQLRAGNVVEQNTSIKNFPNPFSGETTIEFELNADAEVSLFVSDINGKVVATLLESELSKSGVNQQVFNGQHLAQGVYYCTLIANDKVSTQKMVLMK